MKKYSLPQVCLLRSDGPARCYAIREVAFDEENHICEISEETLSPKCSSSDELRKVVLNLLEQAQSGPVICGAPQRAVEKAELESWLRWIGKPVVEIIESKKMNPDTSVMLPNKPMRATCETHARDGQRQAFRVDNETAIAKLRELLDSLDKREQEMGFEAKALRQSIGFFVADHIANAQSAGLLQQCPSWIVDQVYLYVSVLDEQGKVVSYFNTGAVDHTAMAKELKRALENA